MKARVISPYPVTDSIVKVADRRNARRKILVILFALTLVAGIIRGRELGKWCFTVDEYYFQTSVTSIAEKGVPELPSGDYYLRGVLVQYLIALSSLVFPEDEFAARLVPLIFGVLSIPLFFLISRYFLPIYPALLCSLLLLFSSWHIEFSRFARMYAPFQFFFFLFIYFFYSGYYLANRAHRIYCWITAFVSIFVYEGSIFLPFILLLPIVMDDAPLNRRTLAIILVSVFLLGMNYLAKNVPFPYKEFIENPYPPEMMTKRMMTKKPALLAYVFLPDSGLLRTAWQSLLLAVGHVLCVTGGAYMYFKQLKPKRSFWEAIALGVAVLLPLLYQYGLLFYVLLFLFISHKSILLMFDDRRRYWITYFGITMIFWVLVGMTIKGWISPEKNLLHFGKRMFSLLFGYPRVYKAFFHPFLDVIPFWGTVLFIGFIVSAFRYLSNPHVDSKRFLLLVLISCVVMVSAFKTQYTETRYSFFFFPLLYIVAYVETVSLAGFSLRRFDRNVP